MGKRGPAPKNPALKVLSGKAPITKAALAEINEPFQPPAIPEHMNDRERVVWNQTLELLRPLRVLKNVDAAVLGAYCASFVRWQDAENEMEKLGSGLCLTGLAGEVKSIHPLVIISRDAKKDMVFYAAQLAMTPAARLKMISGVSKVREKNPFADLKDRKK